MKDDAAMTDDIDPLPEDARAEWIRTILALSGTEPQRRAFIDGYNGYRLPSCSSSQMKSNHRLGNAVRARLMENDDG